VTPQLELNVLVDEAARHHHLPLYSEIVHRAHKQGLAGASVFRGIEGFGRSHHLHESRKLDLGAHLPVVVVIVDEEPRIREFATEIRALVGEIAVVTVRPVEIVTIGRR
jgi:hypothetical protein